MGRVMINLLAALGTEMLIGHQLSTTVNTEMIMIKFNELEKRIERLEEK